MTTLFHFIGDLLSPAGECGRLTMLIYHRALAAPDPILHDEIDAATFERYSVLLAVEFSVLPLEGTCARRVLHEPSETSLLKPLLSARPLSNRGFRATVQD